MGFLSACNDSLLLDYLSHRPNLTLRSSVISGKIRNHRNKLTDFLNGDRYVYVEAGFTPVLDPDVTLDGGHKCKVWHANQALKCKRCSNEGHRTTDINPCPAYDYDYDYDYEIILFRHKNKNNTSYKPRYK